MARFRITAPVPHVVSTIAGVAFAKSVGHTDDLAAVIYFKRQGYGVEDLEELAALEAEQAAAVEAEAAANAVEEAEAKRAAEEAEAAAKKAAKGGAK